MVINQAYGVLSDEDARSKFDRAWSAARYELGHREQSSAGSTPRRADPGPRSSYPARDPYWTDNQTIYRRARVAFMLAVVFVLAVLWVLKAGGQSQP